MNSRKYLSRREARGVDDEGKAYSTIEDMWNQEVGAETTKWYTKAIDYWSSLEPTIESVLGGYREIHEPDVAESVPFLRSLLAKGHVQPERALDCGAGIGRVTKAVLLPEFAEIDLMEPCAHFLECAKAYVDSSKVRQYIQEGAQDWTENERKYDLIWIQWVLSQLVDEDLTAFLQRVKTALKPGGVVVVKENIRIKGFMVHTDDYSVTRSEKMLKEYFRAAGFRVFKEHLQVEWPPNLLKIKMFALKPSLD